MNMLKKALVLSAFTLVAATGITSANAAEVQHIQPTPAIMTEHKNDAVAPQKDTHKTDLKKVDKKEHKEYKEYKEKKEKKENKLKLENKKQKDSTKHSNKKDKKDKK